MDAVFRHEPRAGVTTLGTEGAPSRHLRSVAPAPAPARGSLPAATIDARGYEAIDDPLELHIILRELHRVRAWIGQFADIAAEMPGYEIDSVRAAKANAAMVTLLIERAEVRLRALTAQAGSQVVVLDPPSPIAGDLAGAVAIPTVNATTVPAPGLSSATLTLAPGRVSVPHVYPDCDVIAVVVAGAAQLIWWDDDDLVHRLPHQANQHAYIRRATRHCFANAGAAPMVAVQVLASAEATAGTALPDLATKLPADGSPDKAGVAATG